MDSIQFQNDGSLLVQDSSGKAGDSVIQGTPRQSIQLGGQSCHVSYGINSAGKTTVLVSLPAQAKEAAVFRVGDKQVTLPPKSALRIVLGEKYRMEKMDGNPPDSVMFSAAGTVPGASSATAPEKSPALEAAGSPAPGTPGAALSSQDSLLPAEWPGKLLEAPIPPSLMEEDQFYVRTELGARFMSSLSLVGIGGSQSNLGNYVQKQFAFGTGYRQDFDIGVQLIDWFGLSFETGFALNSIRGNTQNMTVSDSTFWTFPLLAQLCFQYPNDSGWIPYLNFGFGGAVTVLKLGQVVYADAPTLSGTGNFVTNAYQIAAGVRYRLYEELSLNLAYKFYGNSQGTANLNNGVQLTLGSPVTNSAEIGVNFSF